MRNKPVVIKALDDHNALVEAALSAAYTQFLRFRPGASALPAETNVTLTWAPEDDKGASPRASSVIKEAHITVAKLAPVSYVRGQVWLCTDQTSPRYRTFSVCSATAPQQPYWYLIENLGDLFEPVLSLTKAESLAYLPVTKDNSGNLAVSEAGASLLRKASVATNNGTPYLTMTALRVARPAAAYAGTTAAVVSSTDPAKTAEAWCDGLDWQERSVLSPILIIT